MARFPTAGHLCSWAKFSPAINSSAGKTTGNGSTGHGNRYLARVQAKSLMDDSEFDAVLASHNLDAQLLHKARFAEFLADRRRRFVGMVEHAMGKEVYRDVDEENYAAGVEGPEAFSR